MMALRAACDTNCSVVTALMKACSRAWSSMAPLNHEMSMINAVASVRCAEYNAEGSDPRHNCRLSLPLGCQLATLQCRDVRHLHSPPCRPVRRRGHRSWRECPEPGVDQSPPALGHWGPTGAGGGGGG